MRILDNIRSFIICHAWLRRLLQVSIFILVTGLFSGNLHVSIFVSVLVYWYLNPREILFFKIELTNFEYPYAIGDRILGAKNGASVTLPHGVSLPHIFIDMHSNDTFFSSEPNFKDIFPQKLEASFGQQTTIFAKGEERLIVLSILNPRVMEAIELHAKSFDIEFIGDHIFFYSPKRIRRDVKRLDECHAAIHSVVEALDQTFIHMSRRKLDKYKSMQFVPSDRVLKARSIRLGSARRIITGLIVIVHTYISAKIILDSYNYDNSTDQTALRILISIIWLCVVLSMFIIGYSKKKIDVRW